jgi:putative addiction module component (TIGR02574 family)
MPHTYEEVRQLAYELPEDQRILLANSLWESVDAEECSEAEAEAAWKTEAERRVAEDEAGIGVDHSLEEVVEPLRARLAR